MLQLETISIIMGKISYSVKSKSYMKKSIIMRNRKSYNGKRLMSKPIRVTIGNNIQLFQTFAFVIAGVNESLLSLMP